MGRKLKSSEVTAVLEDNLRRGLTLSEIGKLRITAAYISMALDALQRETGKQAQAILPIDPSGIAPDGQWSEAVA